MIPLAIAFACLGLAFLAVFSPTASLLLRLGIGRIVYSTSNAALLLGLGVFASSAFVVATRPAAAAPRNAFLRFSPSLFAVTLVIGHVVHLIALVAWARDPATVSLSPQFVWASGAQSFTSLDHSHLGKPGLDALADLFRFDLHARGYDAGEPLARLVAEPLSWTIAMACIASVLLLVASIPRVHAHSRVTPGRIIAFVVGGISCAQLVADGGPLSLRLGPSALLLALSLPSSGTIDVVTGKQAEGSTDWTTRVRSRWLVGAGWLVLHLAVVCFAANRSLLSGALAIAPQLCLYGLILGPGVWIPDRRAKEADSSPRVGGPAPHPARRSARRWLAAGFGLVLAIGVARDVENDVFPLLSPLPPEARVTCIALERLTYDAECPTTAGLSPLALYAARGHAFKPTDLLIRREASEDVDRVKPFLIVFEPDRDTEITLGNSDLFAIKALYTTRLAAAAWIVEIEAVDAGLPSIATGSSDAVAHQNRHVWMRILDAALRRSGIEDYVLIPLDRPREFPP